MIEAIILIGIGAFIALYFTHKTFREKVHDVGSHTKSLFKQSPSPVVQPTDTATITARPGETLKVTGPATIESVPRTTN